MIFCIRSEKDLASWVLHNMILITQCAVPLVGTGLSLGTLAFRVTVRGDLVVFCIVTCTGLWVAVGLLIHLILSLG